ncbi:hypothetical protein [Enterovirga sp.]|jgi:hypothetical protein|uniref:hypothetical protein n=1 Tax=Enterovirga sp. TaxID=2026350 RepID=UPI00262BB7C9|nr:hypothetical protein [Enterovirga sp.]MDB5591882.1 hypothetical protein [Enterovirga sp.]
MLPNPRDRVRRGGSTAAVLWLMILLVFLPIAAGHLLARQVYGDGPRAEQRSTGIG